MKNYSLEFNHRAANAKYPSHVPQDHPIESEHPLSLPKVGDVVIYLLGEKPFKGKVESLTHIYVPSGNSIRMITKAVVIDVPLSEMKRRLWTKDTDGIITTNELFDWAE